MGKQKSTTKTQQDRTRKMISATVSDEARERIAELSAALDLPKSQVIEKAIERYWKRITKSAHA